MLDWVSAESIDRPVLIAMVGLILVPIVLAVVLAKWLRFTQHRPLSSRMLRLQHRVDGRDIFFVVVVLGVIAEVLVNYRHPVFDDWFEPLGFLLILPLVLGYWLYFVDKPEQELKAREREQEELAKQTRAEDRPE